MGAQLDLGNYAWAIGKAFGELATRDSDVTEEDRETTIIRYITSGHPARLPVRALPHVCTKGGVSPPPPLDPSCCSLACQAASTYLYLDCLPARLLPAGLTGVGGEQSRLLWHAEHGSGDPKPGS